jgi:hypothetical protein
MFVVNVHFKGGFIGTMCLGVRVLCGDLRYPAVAYGILRELAVGVRALAVIMQGSA